MRFASLLVLIAVVACSSTSKTSAAPLDETRAKAVLEVYSANLYSAYSDSVTDEQAFSARVEAFLASPDETTLSAAKASWLESRAHYMLTEGARFYDGPIDMAPAHHESALNSWPLDEAYIDYSTNKDTKVVDETVGIVNDRTLLPTLDIAGLDALNARGGDTNISNGYHSIEFLLWGQALVDVGPGTRPATDYVVGGPRKNADRRAAYLRVATAGVVSHLTALRDAWAPSAAYRGGFVTGGKESIARALTGLGRLSKGELASQRIDAPYASKSRRDQHDCFSSLTLVDYERDARGMLAMYQGTYGSSAGPGLDSLVRAVDADVDARLTKQLQASIDAIVAIPKPFEAAIVGEDTLPGRVALRAAVVSLRAQGDLFGEAATTLGLTIQVPNEN